MIRQNSDPNEVVLILGKKDLHFKDLDDQQVESLWNDLKTKFKTINSNMHKKVKIEMYERLQLMPILRYYVLDAAEYDSL